MAALTWEEVEGKHYEHCGEKWTPFDACRKEPCASFKKIMPKHHWHGPDFGPGDGCCGCSGDREKVSRFGNESHCPDDRVVPIR